MFHNNSVIRESFFEPLFTLTDVFSLSLGSEYVKRSKSGNNFVNSQYRWKLHIYHFITCMADCSATTKDESLIITIL